MKNEILSNKTNKLLFLMKKDINKTNNIIVKVVLHYGLDYGRNYD